MHILAKHSRAAHLALLGLLYAAPLAAGTNPWVTTITNLQTIFQGTIATGLSAVAIVLGGLMFAFGEGGSKKAIAGIIFGAGMAVQSANFLAWMQ